MATATFHGVMGCSSGGQWGHYGGSSYAANQWGYVDYTGYGYKTRAKITVAPDANKKITDITVTVTVYRNGNTNLKAYLCTSEGSTAAGATTSAPTSYISSPAREVTPNNNANPGTSPGTQWSFTFHNLSITSQQTYYVWWQTAFDISGSLTEIRDGYGGAPRGSVSLTQASTIYTVSYNANGGSSTPSAQNVTIGGSITLAAAISRSNSGNSNSFTVAYNANSGTSTPSTQTSTKYTKYTFEKWHAGSTSGTGYAAKASYKPSGNITMYAGWNSSTVQNAVTLASKISRNNYVASRTVTFKGNGGTASKSSVTSTQTTTYSFANWRLNGTSGTAYNAGASYTPSANCTMYASWSSSTGSWTSQTAATGSRSSTSSSCTVTFNATANGGSCSTSSLTSTRTTSYTCTGWWTATSGGTRRVTSGGTFTPSATETLYAQWSSSTSAYSAITLPTATKTGWTFAGWATSSSASTGVTGSYTPTGSVTLYAIFKQNVYTLTVGKNGVYQGSGTSTETFSLAYNATKDFRDGFTEGKGFGGWYWTGSTTWKNFGTTTYCATVASGGNQRSGAWQNWSEIAIYTYNNAGNTTRPVTTSYPSSSNSGTGYVWQAAFSASSSGSAYGFYGPIVKGTNLYNSRWIHVFRAKIPSSYYLVPTNNACGDNNQLHWLTDNKGTGGWKDYAYERVIGSSGTINSYTFGYVSLSTDPTTVNVPKVAVTIQVAFSIIYRGAEVAVNRTLTMPNSAHGIYAQCFEYKFWTLLNLNGGSSSIATKTYHNYGTTQSIPVPYRSNYTFDKWDRIFATNIFKETYRYINTVSGNAYSIYKIQLMNEAGSYMKSITGSSDTVVDGTWTCDVTSGLYYVRFGMNGSTADHTLYERVWLYNGSQYGYHWERVNNTSGQDITINNFIFGIKDTTQVINYPTDGNYSLYLSARWLANGYVYLNANGGWLKENAHASYLQNNTDTGNLLGRLKSTSTDVHNTHNGYSADAFTFGSSRDLSNVDNPNHINLERYGYSIDSGAEWCTAADGTGTAYNHNTSYAATAMVPGLGQDTPAETEVYANWVPNIYTFNLEDSSGTLNEGTTVSTTYGTIATLPTCEKENYTFKGWFVKFDGINGIQFGRDYMYEDTISVYFRAYSEDWSDTTSRRLISCTETGGWGIGRTATGWYAEAYDGGTSSYKTTYLDDDSILTPGFHDFNLVFAGAGTPLKLYIDGVERITSANFTGNIKYRVLATSINEIWLGNESAAFNHIENFPFKNGYIGNLVINHNSSLVDSTYAQTHFMVPCQDVTVESLFQENAYTEVTLNLAGGHIILSNGTRYNDGDTFKIYADDVNATNITYTAYPPIAKAIQAIVSYRTEKPIANGGVWSRKIGQPMLVCNPPSIAAQNTTRSPIPISNSMYILWEINIPAELQVNLPVVRWQYNLTDDNNNQIVDDNGNPVIVTVKYITYRWNQATGQWQRCIPSGYVNGKWKEGI